jgi:hypothetical protein
VCLAGGIATGILALLPSPAAASGGFSATAAAAGVRVTITAQNAPVTSTPVDGGGPVAQATLDSLGASQAFASFPYPGDAVVSLPGTVAGLTGDKVHLPGYPFYVSSDYPLNPHSTTSQGPYAISASSAPDKSEAQASAGLQAGANVASSTSRSSVVQAADGTLTATSTSDTVGFNLGAVTIGSVHGDASVIFRSDGTMSRASHLSILGMTVAGTSVGLSDQGLVLAGTTVPLASTDALNSILRAENIRLDYVAAHTIGDGVISAGLQITTAQNLPDVGAATSTYTLGLDTASGQRVVAVIDQAGPAGGAPPVKGPASFSNPARGRPVVSGSPTAVPVGPSVVAPTTLRSSPRLASTSPLPLFSMSRIYLVLVAAGLSAVGLALLISNLGVRLKWNF